jgi:tetratricopeptide (TPR) repeat protein
LSIINVSKKTFGVKSMLKKATVTLTLFIFVLWINILANAQTPVEIEFADLLRNADSSFDLGNYTESERYLSEANEIINQNARISENLQGHYLKIKGKQAQSLDAALGYFNAAFEKFAESPLDQAETDLFRAIAYYNAGEYKTAQTYLTRSKGTFLLKRDFGNLAQVLNNEAVIAFMQGDAQTANNLCQQALSINLEINSFLNAFRNKQNIDFFNGRMSVSFYKTVIRNPIRKDGGAGTSGSGTSVGTSGGGTVVVGSGGGGH